ncbi:MAG: DUF5110 domain-containing protein [Clostridia bacterium]|jgi:alpha-glucosidase (family GH31 glycosyl hydrolase)|nr:DUF5110 domain-containing protein [Clostridia bacterium]
MEEILFGNVRIQLLNENIVRVEYGKNGFFCDKNTFFIPNRTEFQGGVAYTKNDGVIRFGKYELYIPAQAESLAGVCLKENGETIYEYQPLKNSGELPPLDQTPKAFALSDTPRIIVPEGGYSAARAGEYTIEEHVQDIYILLCKQNAKMLRRLYVSLTGRNELVRLSTLGSWNSKYFVYDEESAKQLILDYEAHRFPLDNMVIDTDWRAASDRGIGYDVNLNLFPDMARFMQFAHSHGVEIMFNDHPEPVEGAENVFSPAEIAYREEKLQSLLQVGLDIWWYDRNWHTKLKSPVNGVNPETLGLYLFEDVTRHHYQKAAKNKEIYRRPVIMGNVDDIVNGFYCAITNSASHRYSVQWTGDILSDFYALGQEVESLIRGGNNAIAYINADCGGHVGNPTKEEFIRWMQFGTLSPVFRPHCTINLIRNREPWVYDKETEDIVREFNYLRYRLLPVIYKNAYENYCTGEPIFKSLGFEYPQDPQALACRNEYMLGNDLLIAPVMGNNAVLLRREEYVEPVKATFFRGTELQGDPLAFAEWELLFMNLNGIPPMENVPVFYFSARFETTVLVEREKELYLLSDDGATVWIDGKKVLEDKTTHATLAQSLGKIRPNVPHKVVIEYFQASGQAFCGLYASDCGQSDREREVYLPSGKWIDVFNGKLHAGNQTVARQYALNEMPLFVRTGALLPLAYDAKNTKEQKWDKLVYDFYPEKNSVDEGYLYEDDTETTAYKQGSCRKSAYRAGYCKECDAYVVDLFKAEGSFAGEKCFAQREIVFKVHLLGREKITKVTLNGETVSYRIARKGGTSFPLSVSETDSYHDLLFVTVSVQSDRAYDIKFYLA